MYSLDEVFLRSLECYISVYFPSCFASWEINTKITPWTQKQFVTIHLSLYDTSVIGAIIKIFQSKFESDIICKLVRNHEDNTNEIIYMHFPQIIIIEIHLFCKIRHGLNVWLYCTMLCLWHCMCYGHRQRPAIHATSNNGRPSYRPTSIRTCATSVMK